MTYRYASTADIVMAVVGSTATSSWAVRAPTELQLLASTDFRGVISDFRTPGGINGTDVRDWLLRHRPNLANRIIFITGDTASPETISLLAQAGTPCVEKPFRVHQLMAAVEKAMGKP